MKINHIHLEKKGLRGLAIAESFKQGDKSSKLAGIVIRRDFIIDGFVFGHCTIEGDDATESIIDMYERLSREDINFILISGIIIAMYNVINIEQISIRTGLPVIGITYEESEGIDDAIKHHFPDNYETKIESYQKLGSRTELKLHTGYSVYIRNAGCSVNEAKKLVEAFTLQGSVPEPLRVAQLLAKTPVS